MGWALVLPCVWLESLNVECNGIPPDCFRGFVRESGLFRDSVINVKSLSRTNASGANYCIPFPRHGKL